LKVWIDVLTPKQVNFAEALTEGLCGRGYTAIVTTRAYREVEELIRLRGFKAKSLGWHGGGDREGKLLASASRVLKLAKHVRRMRPDITISFASPEAARVAFGLGIEHMCICDSPHAEAVLRLTLPLASTLFSPSIIPARLWKQFNPRLRLVGYRALDPVVWIRRMKGGRRPLGQLELDPRRPAIIVRPAESQAAYLMGRSDGIDAPKLIRSLIRQFPHAQVVALPRYEAQYSDLRRSGAIVPRRIVDGLGLLRRSSVFIGAGGTMTTEAALLGTPTISCYPSDPTIVERYLISQGLVRRCDSLAEVLTAVGAALKDDGWRERARRISSSLIRRMEDPVDVILSRLPSS